MALIIIYTEYSLPRPPRLSLGFTERALGQVSIHLSVDFFYMKRYCVMERETGLEPATSCLEGRSSGQLNYSRKGKGQSGDCPREDRNFKERGEDFFFIPVLLLYQKFFEKSTHFLMNQRQYSWYASSRSGKSR